MDTINLTVIRIGSFMSRHVCYEVWFQNKKLGDFFRAEDAHFTINREKGVLKLREFGTKFAFHTIEKEVVIFPEHMDKANKELKCYVNATTNWLGVLTYGLLAPIRKVNIRIEY